MGRACSRNGENRNAYGLFVGKSERKRPLDRSRRRWVDNIKMNPVVIRLVGMVGIDVAQGRTSRRFL
jgi:hypothetical protein